MQEYQVAWCIRDRNRVAGLCVGEAGWTSFRKGWVVRRESVYEAAKNNRCRFFVEVDRQKLYLGAEVFAPDADYVPGVTDFFKPDFRLDLSAPPRRYEPMKTPPPWEPVKSISRS